MAKYTYILENFRDYNITFNIIKNQFRVDVFLNHNDYDLNYKLFVYEGSTNNIFVPYNMIHLIPKIIYKYIELYFLELKNKNPEYGNFHEIDGIIGTKELSLPEIFNYIKMNERLNKLDNIFTDE